MQKGRTVPSPHSQAKGLEGAAGTECWHGPRKRSVGGVPVQGKGTTKTRQTNGLGGQKGGTNGKETQQLLMATKDRKGETGRGVFGWRCTAGRGDRVQLQAMQRGKQLALSDTAVHHLSCAGSEAVLRWARPSPCSELGRQCDATVVGKGVVVRHVGGKQPCHVHG
eukprot:GGOE01047253.1.p3 GENE.GGOE01047253.1~~GGOE01047253.1.p3  ORF type:complete len:166 (-),score=3.94 GGOE01047253.1:144-641(-)